MITSPKWGLCVCVATQCVAVEGCLLVSVCGSAEDEMSIALEGENLKSVILLVGILLTLLTLLSNLPHTTTRAMHFAFFVAVIVRKVFLGKFIFFSKESF